MFIERLKSAIQRSLRPAFKTAMWMLKMMLPITLAVAVLDYVGVIEWVSNLMSPFFGFIGLPGEAGLVFISSVFANLYSAVAVMASLNMDYRSVTILCVMCLIAHNMIIETMIQRKTGANTRFIVPLRIVAALAAGFLLNLVVPENLSGRLMFGSIYQEPTSWQEVFLFWFNTSYPLIIKMFAIIFGLNILQNILREFGIINLLIYPLRPLMKAFGLKESTSFLWIVANVIGLAYGGAIMIEEVESGEINQEDAKLFNTHIALSHSMLEDTLLFVAIGVGAVWLIVPRVIFAVAAVWGQRFYFNNVRRKMVSRQI